MKIVSMRGTNNILKNNRWLLILYDAIVYAIASIVILFYNGRQELEFTDATIQCLLIFIFVMVIRLIIGVYRQIWRYGNTRTYMILIIADAIAFTAYYFFQFMLPIKQMGFLRCFALISMNLLGCIVIRIVYSFVYKYCNEESTIGRIMCFLLKISGSTARPNEKVDGYHRIKVAIIGAGNRGSAIAEEINAASRSPYKAEFFVDINKEIIGRSIGGLPVYGQDEITKELLEDYNVQEVILAVPSMKNDVQKQIYQQFKELGCKVKVYDAPAFSKMESSKIREIEPSELLFRKEKIEPTAETISYYKDKTILITGGGGSIGSEICRQLAPMEPKKLVLLDIYENGAYDIQQELRIAYHGKLEVCIEIASIRDREALDRVFEEHRPEIVIMAAAHKHVPLMEKNCIEAVRNNVFGTLNTIEAGEKYGARRIIMVSTDKAVNPTNIMGATKRMCEMIVQSHALRNRNEGTGTTYSITRFGNVLGSAGSVIPLFKRQIEQGGPVTVTDKRIIRYFMTIPEASLLVLTSGAMAKNGELFVLDMGQPVKIYELAQNMIQLSGMQGIDIVETGLRPGEKLYEELLIKTEEMDKTDNDLIYIERDQALSIDEINKKLELLREACNSGSDDEVKAAMRKAVSTYLGSSIN